MIINCKGALVDLSIPKIMGILNVTPDSFFDGGNYISKKSVLQQCEKMLNDGANFIDIGAYSSRPGAKDVSETEETERLLNVITPIMKEFPDILLSVDTFRSSVAKASIEAGAAIVNDISGGDLDDNMFATVSELQVPYILMHMKGTPQNMQTHTGYKNITKEVNLHLSEKVYKARSYGINDIILDPGFGFAKTLEENYELMNHMEMLHFFDLPILVGISRKSMIYKLFDTTPDNALNGTSILNTIALQKRAHILRVHDVKEASECVTIWNQLNATTIS
ncbi:dihydropteroate synthase [Neptunitalea chrysea]|uniref:Dihydropteroate synthase n=1 Tax=Neptunitalea chrysea TaxID=1647581 RepID=A0A9W6B7M2_9FLAO|nr:dihydropteroate synthase [Neptunitalea chrysea]GLB54026.1 dihydropteroate synthase [Neptunitalea chrysea]